MDTQPTYDDAEVLAGAERTVTLGEKEFVLREPVRSRARKLRSMFQKMQELFEAAQKGEVSPDIDVEQDMVDTICQFNEELDAAREYIDDNATPSQILEVYYACGEMISDPLECTANRLARRTAAKAEARQNGNTENPSATKPA